MTGLLPNTFYRVRAYATNAAGTSYGAQQTFSTNQEPILPTVTTTTATTITQTTAVTGGTVMSDGGSPVTVRGVCYSTSPNPTTANSKTTDGSGIGGFVSSLSGLTPSTVYYVRAYATNGVGTGYGSDITFLTQNSICDGITSVLYEGKSYNTIAIGNQCWFKENLNIGTRVNGTINQTNNGINEKYCYNNLESNCEIYGGLYQWDEMMLYSTIQGTQGICPIGWHIPSDNEWSILISFLEGSNLSGGKMKEVGFVHWSSPNTSASNSSEFTGLGSGARTWNGTSFGDLLLHAYYWSSTDYPGGSAWSRILSYSSSVCMQGNDYKTAGFSVRCCKN
jgi:uncharacterized protein (TIGR02145 family)